MSIYQPKKVIAQIARNISTSNKSVIVSRTEIGISHGPTYLLQQERKREREREKDCFLPFQIADHIDTLRVIYSFLDSFLPLVFIL